MNKLISVFSILILSLASCMQEKGSYSYDEINRIMVGNIKEMESVLQFESPDIVPEITQSFYDGEDNLEFLWAVSKDDKKDTLCTHRNFDVPVALVPGIHYLTYYIIDKNTGIYTATRFTLEVKSVLGSGLMVLSDLNGQANLAYIYDDKVFPNIEQTIPGGLGKNPVEVYYFPKSSKTPAYVAVFCKDERGGAMLDAVTLTKEMDYKDFFEMSLNTVDPQGYIHSKYGYKLSSPSYYCGDLNFDFICNEGLIYDRYIYASFNKMNAAYSSSDEKGYEASPWMMSYDGYGFLYIYDRKNHRFMQKEDRGSNRLMPVETWPQSNVFDPLDVGEGMELVFGDIGYVNDSKPMYYLVFKEKTKYYCVKTWIYYSYFLTPYKEEINAPIDEHTCFGVHLMAPSLYYSVGDIIYNFDTESRTSELRWSAKGQKITCIKAEPFIKRKENGTLVYDHMRLYVGVSGTAVNGKAGSVYILKANNDNSLEEIAHYKNISGEIKSFAWKW